MLINTSRFGEVDVDAGRIITFVKGLLGFPKYRRYVLIEAGPDSSFWWLQSIELPDLAFVVTDPSLFDPTYQLPIRREQMEEMGIESRDEAQVFVVVNKHGDKLTGNLQGPIVIYVGRWMGEQLVLNDRRYTTRVPLIEVGLPAQAAMA